MRPWDGPPLRREIAPDEAAPLREEKEGMQWEL